MRRRRLQRWRFARESASGVEIPRRSSSLRVEKSKSEKEEFANAHNRGREEVLDNSQTYPPGRRALTSGRSGFARS